MATKVADRIGKQKEKEKWEIDMEKKHNSRNTSQGQSLSLPCRRTSSSSPENEGGRRCDEKNDIEQWEKEQEARSLL